MSDLHLLSNEQLHQRYQHYWERIVEMESGYDLDYQKLNAAKRQLQRINTELSQRPSEPRTFEIPF